MADSIHHAKGSPQRSMFWRLWRRSLTVKRPQAGLAIGSVVLGAAVASLLLNLYGDVRRKMTQEFRAYGANVIVAPPATAGDEASGAVMDESVMKQIAPQVAPASGRAAVPVLYAVVELKRQPPDPRLPDFQNVVAAGSDFGALRRLNPGWRLTGTAPDDASSVVVGAHVASALHVKIGDSLLLDNLSSSAAAAPRHVVGIVSTGASEDDQVFLPLAELQVLAGLEGKISLVELSIPGETPEIEKSVNELTAALPELDVRPVRQIVYASGHVLGTIRWMMLSLTGLILIIIALCITATMTAIVLERRKDVAVMKALGAGDRLVMRLFLAEGAALGLVGATAGFIAGLALAYWVARRLFAVILVPAWWTLPAILGSGMLLAVLATMFPVRLVRGVEPATTLKGE